MLTHFSNSSAHLDINGRIGRTLHTINGHGFNLPLLLIDIVFVCDAQDASVLHCETLEFAKFA